MIGIRVVYLSASLERVELIDMSVRGSRRLSSTHRGVAGQISFVAWPRNGSGRWPSETKQESGCAPPSERCWLTATTGDTPRQP